MASDWKHHFDCPTAKELRHGELLNEFPEGALGGEEEAAAVVGEVPDGGRYGAGGKGDLMGLENFFGGVGGGGYDEWDRAEAETE